MPDPFDALRSPVAPLAPDPAFTARLRRRLTRALSPTPSKEEHMTDVLLRNQYSRNGTRPGDISYVSLGVPDADAGRAFYGSVLGWRFAPGQLDQTDSQVDDVIPQVGLWSGSERGPRTGIGAVLAFRVDDIGSAVRRVREAGGTASEPAERPYGLEADCSDGHGLGFWLHQLPPTGRAAPPNGERQGDVSHVVVLVEDLDQASAFFSAVLGWTVSPGYSGGLHAEGATPMLVLFRSQGGRPGAALSYRVDDIDAAVERVREAGGSASEPLRRPYGLQSDCTDDQGVGFFLHQPPG